MATPKFVHRREVMNQHTQLSRMHTVFLLEYKRLASCQGGLDALQEVLIGVALEGLGSLRDWARGGSGNGNRSGSRYERPVSAIRLRCKHIPVRHSEVGGNSFQSCGALELEPVNEGKVVSQALCAGF